MVRYPSGIVTSEREVARDPFVPDWPAEPHATHKVDWEPTFVVSQAMPETRTGEEQYHSDYDELLLLDSILILMLPITINQAVSLGRESHGM